MTTLYAYLNGLSELKGRVYMDVAPTAPATPYAIVWDAPGGIETELFGTGDVGRVFPRVTLYDKPKSGENPAAARARLMSLFKLAEQATRAVDTHSDGVTPFTGLLRRTNVAVPMPDKNVPGQFYGTLFFTALIDRP